MRQFIRFALRIAIMVAIVWAVRRFLNPHGGAPADALAKGEDQVKQWIDSARKHVEDAVADGRQAASEARRDLESAAGAALEGPDEARRPDESSI